MDIFKLLFYLPIIIFVIFIFIFIFANMFLDAKSIFYPKNNNIRENFISLQMRTFEDNKFRQIILPNTDDYDLEVAIPTDQKLNPTVQGNWGFNQDENGKGFSTGVYRDGYTADGSIFKGISEKRYKYMLDQGPYVIRYENRINKEKKYDVRIFLNNKEVIYAKNEGISSGNLKYIGTNESLYNKKTDSTNEGRRPIDYLKFIPKSNKKN